MEDIEDEDCAGSSGDEDARERFFDSAPSKRDLEMGWEDCAIPVDAREAAGVQSRRAGLRQAIGDGEPVLSLFQMFFPMQLFMSHLQELKARKPGPTGSRHNIPWDQGVFLRFLGLLIRFAIMPQLRVALALALLPPISPWYDLCKDLDVRGHFYEVLALCMYTWDLWEGGRHGGGAQWEDSYVQRPPDFVAGLRGYLLGKVEPGQHLVLRRKHDFLEGNRRGPRCLPATQAYEVWH